MLSAASESVTEWPIVNAVTMRTSDIHPPPSRSNPTRNRMWSGPIMMCSIPEGMKTFSTASDPWVVPEK